MSQVIRFKTDLFDVSQERQNPINPIHGESLLLWLQERTKGELVITHPEPEDWGWYSLVDWQGCQYLLGAALDDDEWIFQVDKRRTAIESLTGRAKMTDDDPCFAYFLEQLRTDSRFHELQIE